MRTQAPDSAVPSRDRSVGARLASIVATIALAFPLAVAFGCASEPPERPALTETERDELEPMWKLFVSHDKKWPEARGRWLAMSESARNTLIENMIRYMSDRFNENKIGEANRAAAELILYDRHSLEYLGALCASEGNAMGLREMAAGCLVRIGTPAVPALRRSLASTRYRARRLAVRALGRIRERGSIPDLVAVLERDDNFVVRAEAATALGSFAGETAAEDALLRSVGDEDPVVAAAVAQALGRLGSHRAVPGLVKRLGEAGGDESVKLRKAIRAVLGRITALDPSSPVSAFEAWRPPVPEGS